MNPSLLESATYFHIGNEFELPHVVRYAGSNKSLKYFIIQKRQLRYRFALHQHPYVQQLAQRLLQKGTAGLQAADTDYAPGELSLPFGVDIALETAVVSPFAAGVAFRPLTPVVAKDAANNDVALDASEQLTLAAVVQADVLAGTRATLSAALQPTPRPHASFSLAAAQTAVAFSDTAIHLTAAASALRFDGTTVTIPAATIVAVAAGTAFDVPAGTGATLLRRRMRPAKDLYAEFFDAYKPASPMVERPFPVKDLDFSSSGAYAVYNWELFFHVPMTIAINLSKNQRFAEAQRWFHFLFDPTDDSDGPTPERFWKVRPFQYTDVAKAEELLVNLATGADPVLREDTINSIAAWQAAPFRPHVIARYRQQAYMYKTVMAYLDNLIAWGDSLFRQDTGEAVDEALQLYVLAAGILGPRPQLVPKKGTVRRQTYATLQKDLRQFGTVMREMEPALAFDLVPSPAAGGQDSARLASVRSLGKALYFCVPRNDKLLGYWDTVADRLFKIRNSLNIEGIFRQLALFAPPIDPALLARAAAAGLDIGAVASGQNQPLPLVRFQFLAQKATEIAQEVKVLGSNLLAAMEKEDNEALAALRATHERTMLEMVEDVKYGQLQEAVKSREALLQSLALAVQRYTYYERQLGRQDADISKAMPVLDELKKEGLLTGQLVALEPALGFRHVEVDIAQDLGASGGKIISSYELAEMRNLSSAQDLHSDAAEMNMIAKTLSLIPDFAAKGAPMGVGAAITMGGTLLAKQFGMLADAMSHNANLSSYLANKSAKIGGYAHREQDWTYQSNLAAGEINQIFKQIRAAQIREAVAELDLQNHKQQIKHAKEIESFLNQEGSDKNGKKTNKAFYAWMKREVKGLYAQCFQLAFDVARKAERALQHELGDTALTYLQFGYLAGKEGLLAGEKLYLDIKRMEVAYQDLNRREYELTKHVSLLQVDPLALMQLRTIGRCTVRLPETLFDMDAPGHYFRRIKSVAVSIPCVTGPYASINCRLTLLKSSVRTSPVSDENYARVDAGDVRFSDYFGSLQSIVASAGQNDSGLFETNLRDERYLPFEHSGVISEWRIALPADPSKGEPAQFHYDTISDVIVHLRYTAREGGDLLRRRALAAFAQQFEEGQASGLVRLLSVRSEFPTEWHKFIHTEAGVAGSRELSLALRPEHYPFWCQGRLKTAKVSRVNVLARSTAEPMPATIVVNDAATPPNESTLVKDESFGQLLVGKLSTPVPAVPVGELKLVFASSAFSDLWIAITWQ
jgi:hypothetical protein